jgi:excisionase family DNA binding protein
MDELLLTKKQAASVLGISVRSVEYLLASRKLEGRRLGRRRLVIRRSVERVARTDMPSMSPPKAPEGAGPASPAR